MKFGTFALVCVASFVLIACGATPTRTTQAPGSSQEAYLIGQSGWQTTALMTVGDRVDAYPMVGIPDGLGAYLDKRGDLVELVVLMNHELGSHSGAVHAHGEKGAFISLWRIDPATLRVIGGQDLIQRAVLKTGGPAFGRMCSADLPAVSAFYNAASGLGTPERLFMNGEENGPNGRAFAHVVTGPEAGTSYEFTRMRQASWENLLANPFAQDQTIVIGLDDTHPKANAKSRPDLDAGKLYVYVGRKQAEGNAFEKAGLDNGQTYFVQVGAGGVESRFEPRSGRFTLAASGGANFMRPEDGTWDPKHPNVFYFLTTDRMTEVKDADGAGRSRLYRLTFDDIRTPLAGGRIDALLSGTEGYEMLDNLTMTDDGALLMQEDVGNHPRLGRIWRFEPNTGKLETIAEHDPQRFSRGGKAFLTEDEESSGIVNVTGLLAQAHPRFADGRQYFLLSVQAHYATTPELVEGGQLLLLASPPAGN